MYENGKLEVLNIADILPNRFQPRIRFDEEKLEELASSIGKYGVIQPIVVRPIGGKYEIIAGERRFKASRLANKSTIPAIIVNLSDKDSEEIALLENIQRQQLTAIEEAVSYKRILDMGYITQEELAKKIGKSQSTIANKIRLLNLDDVVQSYLLNNRISERHARSLLRIADKDKQVSLLHKIVSERLTVKQTDKEIEKILEEEKNGVSKVVQPSDNALNQVNVQPIQNNINVDKVVEPVIQEIKPNVSPIQSDVPMNNVNVEQKVVEPVTQEIKPNVVPSEQPITKPEVFGEENKERTGGFMDIEKIMREAKDINVPTNEPAKDISNLMVSKNDVQSEPIVSETSSEPVFNAESGKFVNVQPKVEEPEIKKEPVISNFVTFDSVFNQGLVQSPVQNPTPQPSPVQTPVQDVQPNVVQNPVQQMQNVEPVQNNPIQTPVQPSVQTPVQPSLVQEPVQSVNTQPEIETLVDSEISEKTKNSISNAVALALKKFNESRKSSVNTGQVASTPSVQQMQNVEPIQNNPVQTSVQPSVQTPIQSSVQPQIPTQPSMVQEPVQSVNVQPYTAPVSYEAPKINNQMETLDIPDTSIIGDNINETPTIASNISQSVKSVGGPNFAKIVKLLRDCADQIEQNGYYVDVDELDLGDKYKVTFTIDKE